jgi:hypothetical protein
MIDVCECVCECMCVCGVVGAKAEVSVSRVTKPCMSLLTSSTQTPTRYYFL